MKALLFLIILGVAGYVGYYNYGPDLRFGPDLRVDTKPIHPDEAGFKASTMRFENYSNYKDLFIVLNRIIPVGTPRAAVEAVLTQQTAFQGQQPYNGGNVEYRYKRLYKSTDMFCDRGKKNAGTDLLIAGYDTRGQLAGLMFSEGLTCAQYNLGSTLPAGVQPFRPGRR